MVYFIKDVNKGDRSKEKGLHEKFGRIRVNNEWFKCEEELVDYININSDPALENKVIEKRNKKQSKPISEEEQAELDFEAWNEDRDKENCWADEEDEEFEDGT